MSLPTDPLGISIYIVDLVLQGISAAEAYRRLSDGISAQATAEGREVTDEEMAVIKAARDESLRRMRGQ